MSVRTLLTAAAVLCVHQLSFAENCWLIGCRDSLGYIRLDPAPSQRPLPFVGRALPKVGQTVALCEHAYLRHYPVARPLAEEAPDRLIRQNAVAPGSLLGPNTKVKIIDYVVSKKSDDWAGTFAAVRVLDDDSTCPVQCPQCGGTIY